MRTNDRSAVVPRKEWFTWPVEIFDNLYFIGTRTAGVWAISSSEGIIIVDTNFHYTSKELVLGLLNFGLDPNDIKYIIVTHAHDDRYWGAKALQDTYPNARVAMSAADWDIVAKDNSPAQFKPRKDMVVTDGQKITLGDVTVTPYITPGHTPGTLSLIIEPLTNKKSVASDNERHVASIWGGTDPSIGRQGVQYYPDGQTMMKTHVASLQALHRSRDEGWRRCDAVPHVESCQYGREDAVLENGESRSLGRRRGWEQTRKGGASLRQQGGGLALQPDSSAMLRSPIGVENGLVVRERWDLCSGRLEQSGVATWIRESGVLYGYPLILFLHTLGLEHTGRAQFSDQPSTPRLRVRYSSRISRQNLLVDVGRSRLDRCHRDPAVRGRRHRSMRRIPHSL